MFESRAELRPGRLEALWPLLSGRARAHPLQLGHQVLWQLFATDGTDQQRDFLFQVERQSPLTVILRSARAPSDTLDLWTIRTRPFAPQLLAGQALRFRMECVATRSAPLPGAKRGKRQDAAMHAFRSASPEMREGRTPDDFAVEAGRAWLNRQGSGCGFRIAPEDVELLGYRRHELPSGRDRRRIRFGSLLLSGKLEVVSPDVFVSALVRGFGAGRAFGFGLMQIAPSADTVDL